MENSMSLQTKPNKDRWDKIGVIAACISGILLPLIVVYLGLIINTTIKEKELSVEYVKLAIQLIQNNDSTMMPEQSKTWAMEVLKHYSPVPIPPEFEIPYLFTTVERPNHVTGGGIGGKGTGLALISLRSKPDQYLYVYIDDKPRAATPLDIYIPAGIHTFEWKNDIGHVIGKITTDISDSLFTGLHCNSLSGKVDVCLNIRVLGRGWNYWDNKF